MQLNTDIKHRKLISELANSFEIIYNKVGLLSQYEIINLSIGINALRLRNEHEEMTNKVG